MLNIMSTKYVGRNLVSEALQTSKFSYVPLGYFPCIVEMENAVSVRAIGIRIPLLIYLKNE